MISFIELTATEEGREEEDFGDPNEFTFIGKFDSLSTKNALTVSNTSSPDNITTTVGSETLPVDLTKPQSQDSPIHDLINDCRLTNNADLASLQEGNSPRKLIKKEATGSPLKHQHQRGVESLEFLETPQGRDKHTANLQLNTPSPSISAGNDCSKQESSMSRFFPNLPDNTNKIPEHPIFLHPSSSPRMEQRHASGDENALLSLLRGNNKTNSPKQTLENPTLTAPDSHSNYQKFPLVPPNSSRTSVEDNGSVIKTIQASHATLLPTQSPPGFYDQKSLFQQQQAQQLILLQQQQQQQQQPTMLYQNFFFPGVGMVRRPVHYNLMQQQQQPHPQQQPFNASPIGQYVRFIQPPIFPHQPIGLTNMKLHDRTRPKEAPYTEVPGSPINFQQANQLLPTSPPSHLSSTSLPQQRPAKQLILLPAESMVTLRHKIQFLHEYCLHALGYAGPEAESLKEYIKRSTVSAFQDVDSLEDMPELLVEKMSIDIQLKMESNYSFVHDYLIQVISRDVQPSLATDISTLKQILVELKKRRLALQSEVDMEEEPKTDKVCSILYLLQLFKHELDVCEKLLLAESQPNLYLEIILSFVEVKIQEVKNLVGVSLRSISSENVDDDKDSRYWFAKRRNDPYVKEYQAAYDRRMAPRLPSPNHLENPSSN